MSTISRELLLDCLCSLLRVVVRFCLRHGLKLQDVVECAKRTYVELAVIQLEQSEQKPTKTRIAVMTGVHRRDIMQLLDPRAAHRMSRDLVTRVIGQWQTDQRFVSRVGQPRVLSIAGDDSEFERLVISVSKELSPATVLFELERVGAVSHSPRGIKLAVQTYTPVGDAVAGFDILSNDLHDLIVTVEENIFETNSEPNTHVRTVYDNIAPQAIPEIRRCLLYTSPSPRD